MSILSNDLVLIGLVSLCVFVIFYLMSDRMINFLYRKSMGNREEIIKLLDLMFVEIDQKKITTILLLVSFGFGAAIFILLWPNVILGLIVGAAATVLGWSLPLLLVKNMYDQRATRFTDQMVDGLTIMANGIKAGLSITQSMERVVENLGNPISQEFKLVLSQIRVGRSVEEALIELGERIPKPDVQMFVTSINILKETGGNLAETFQTIVHTIRERQKIEKKIDALTAQGRMQGLIISLVPLVIMIVLFLTDPKFIMPMFTQPLGLAMVVGIIMLIFIGSIAIRKIVKINV